MAFYAETFLYAGIPSEFYGLYLGEFGGTGEAITVTASDVTPLTQKLFRRPSPLYYGAEQVAPLSFPLSMYSEAEITAQDYSLISTWLFGQQNYQILRICQNDMTDIFFKCLLTAPNITREGNIIRGITCTVTCDSPWGYKPSQTVKYVYTGGNIVADTKYFLNESANTFYTYPSNLVITANVFGGYIHITNASDTDREFTLTLSPNEVVTLDCENQIISSTLTTYPLENFNSLWLRLVPGLNTLEIEGNISQIEITVPVATKIGG